MSSDQYYRSELFIDQSRLGNPASRRVAVAKSDPKTAVDGKRRLRVDYGQSVVISIELPDGYKLCLDKIAWSSSANPVQLTQNELLGYGLQVKRDVQSLAKYLKGQILRNPEAIKLITEKNYKPDDLRVYCYVYFGLEHPNETRPEDWSSRYAIQAGHHKNGRVRLVGAGPDSEIGPAGLANLVCSGLKEHGCIQFAGKGKRQGLLNKVAEANFGELSAFIDSTAGPAGKVQRWYARFRMDSDIKAGDALLIQVGARYFSSHTERRYFVLDRNGAPMSGCQLMVPPLESVLFQLAEAVFDADNRQEQAPILVRKYADLYASDFRQHMALAKMIFVFGSVNEDTFAKILMDLADKIKKAIKPTSVDRLPRPVINFLTLLLMQVVGEAAYPDIQKIGNQMMVSPHDSVLGRKIIEEIISSKYTSAASSVGVSVLTPKLEFNEGDQVVLQGLKAEDYNGLVGTVLGFDQKVGRYLLSIPGKGKTTRIKPENLVAHQEAAAPVR